MKNAALKKIIMPLSLLIVMSQLIGCQISNEQIGVPETTVAQSQASETLQAASPYDIKISKLDPIKYSLAAPPASFEDNIMLTFSNQLDHTGCNTAILNATTGDMNLLNFYAGLEFKMDDKNFYFLANEHAGAALTTIKSKKQTSGEETVVYNAPDGYELAPRLSYGDEFLVWTQYKPTDEHTQGFSLWAYDIKAQQAFEISSKCYGSLTYSYIINNGYVAYCDENSTTASPYIITSYDLNQREITGEVSTQGAPNTMVFDGKNFLWCERSGDKSLYVNDGINTTEIVSGVSNFDIQDGEYIVASIGGDYQVLSLTQNSVVFSLKEQGMLNEQERLVPFFTLNKSNGRAVINSIVKQSSENTATEYIYLIDFDK